MDSKSCVCILSFPFPLQQFELQCAHKHCTWRVQQIGLSVHPVCHFSPLSFDEEEIRDDSHLVASGAETWTSTRVSCCFQPTPFPSLS
eukprot:m.101273 g.101273  ORF g.101273 m.101273 type:complete len:88 (+) comp51483_c0_seq18:409-672(+)